MITEDTKEIFEGDPNDPNIIASCDFELMKHVIDA